MALNNVTLMGRICKDVELRRTGNGTAVVSASIAVDRDFSKEKEVDFIDLVMWNKTAELAEKHLHKGSQIAVKGRIQTRKYTDKNGNNRTAVEVVVDSFYFAGSKDSEHTAPAAASTAPAEFTTLEYEDPELPF